MDKWTGKVALVTGASAGIGYSTAELLARNGMQVVACSRNTDKIKVIISLQSITSSGLVRE